jgi:AcrR family transcriptional regulator
MQTLKDDIRLRIIAAARDEFFTAGFKQASTRQIIHRSGISNGNLYNYFKSKDDLLDAVVEPFIGFANDLFETLFNDAGIENFSLAQIERLSETICAMLDLYRKEFLIVMNKSQATHYETYKTGLIASLAEHFQKNVKPEYQNGDAGDGMLMQLAATNIVEGLLKIATEYKNKDWAQKNIRLLFLYHFNGIVQFYPD